MSSKKSYKSVLVTGGAGYIGTKVLEKLVKEENKPDKIVAVDIKEPPEEKKVPGVIYIKEDIRSPKISDIMKEHGVEAVIHLAAIVTPARWMTREFMYDVDVGGTRNILEASVKNGVRQIIITSSGAAYGYHPDNPEWITEDTPLRGNENMPYPHHKRLVEEMLAEYREKYPQLKQLILRPGTILGATVNNQLSAIFDKKFVLEVKGGDSRFVFIWDEDVANIIVKGLIEQKEGIYNLAGTGALSMAEIADLLHKPLIRVPAWLLRLILGILHPLGLSPYGPEQVEFIRYRPVLSNRRLIEEFGYTPQKTSKEVLLYYVEKKRERERKN